MATIVNIADISIYIKGLDFLKNLTLTERKLLQPFIRRRLPAHRPGKHFAVNTKIIKKPRTVNDKPFDPLLVDKVRKYLACPPDNNFKKKTELCLKNFFYSDKNQFRRFVDILMAMGDSSRVMPTKDALFILNRKRRVGFIFSHERQPGYALAMSCLGILRTLLMMIIIEEDGAFFHASSVNEEGKGYVFIGPSGSGKSTTVRMGRFKNILSDDAAAIRRVNRSYMIFPNPWWNKDSKISISYFQHPVPLKAIFFIKKAKKTSMRKIGLKRALTRLIHTKGIFGQIHFYCNAREVKKNYIFSLNLLNSIPVFELRIKKGYKFKQEFQSLLYRYMD